MQGRCAWVPLNDPLYVSYHDLEWGVPLRDDRGLFELLCLEGAQAGLSWRTVLHRREGYRRAFLRFDPAAVAALTEEDVQRLLLDPGIVRNEAKIRATIANARAALALQGAIPFGEYVWKFVGGAPRCGHTPGSADTPAAGREVGLLSQDLKRRGFRFVGPTICYAFAQAAGLVMDHEPECFRHAQLLPQS